MTARSPARLALALALAAVALAAPVSALPRLEQPWPARDAVQQQRGDTVRFPSSSPFTPDDIDEDGAVVDPTEAEGTLFLPPGAHAPRSIPAVVMLHGSGGVLWAREMTYGPQLAAMGVAALAVDAFAARRERGTAFIDRLLNITETMLIADAYAALRFLAARPEIDPERVALVGFSYGAMATMYALNAGMARKFVPRGPRFAAHVAFYGPCIARFADSTTTGAPLLMLYGTEDLLVDRARCDEIASDYRWGGSDVTIVAYEGAAHQWDGSWGRRRVGRNLAKCRFRVERDGTVRDLDTYIPMFNPFFRKVILGLCVGDEAYMIGGDDSVRERSNAELGRFLARAFARPR
ncbi:MAG: dienelactone hydrolase family protein [Alphaproteobacteria bacterium]|nr:dienelactone hydrolase family protein [Alphaproteobacteria bacterium]